MSTLVFYWFFFLPEMVVIFFCFICHKKENHSPSEVFLLSCFVSWELGFVTGKTIFSGLCQPEDACVGIPLVDSWTGYRSWKQHFLSSIMSALKGVCPIHKGPFSPQPSLSFLTLEKLHSSNASLVPQISGPVTGGVSCSYRETKNTIFTTRFLLPVAWKVFAFLG